MYLTDLVNQHMKNLVSIFVIMLFLQPSTVTFAQSSDNLLVETQLSIMPTDVEWSPDGELIGLVLDRSIIFLDTSLQEVTSIPAYTVGQSWNSDGTLLVTGGGFETGQGTVEVWTRDLQTNVFALEQTFANSYLDIVDVELSPNDQYLATLSRSLTFEAEVLTFTVEIWDTSNWSLVTTLRNQYTSIFYPVIVWSPDSSKIAGTGQGFLEDGIGDNHNGIEGAYVAEALTGDRIVFIETEYTPSSISWSSQNELVTDFPDVNVYNPDTGILLRTLGPTRGNVKFNPVGNVVAGYLGGRIDLIDATDGTLILRFQSEPDIRAIDWSPDGNAIVAITESGLVQIWDVFSYVDDISPRFPYAGTD